MTACSHLLMTVWMESLLQMAWKFIVIKSAPSTTFDLETNLKYEAVYF